MTTYRLIVLMDVRPALFDDWADWNREHARDMVAAGFLGGQTFRVRHDYAYIHPESLPGRPPYTMVNLYEVDEAVLRSRLLAGSPAMGQGPIGGTRPFPSPLGPHMGDGYLLEPISDAYRGAAPDPAQPRYRLVILMSVPPALFEEWADWNRTHARDMVASGFLTAQTFRVRTDYAYIHPESLATRPPYTMANLYEVDEAMLRARLVTQTPATGAGPAGGTRPFPSPLGRHLGDGYLLEPISPRYAPLA